MPPQFVTRVTPAQAAAESKKATEEAMRQVAANLNKTPPQHFHENSISDSDSDSEVFIKKRKGHKSSSEDSIAIHKLETRLHYLQLDMANKNIDYMDLKELSDSNTLKLENMKKVDETLSLLSNLTFYLKNLDSLSLDQVKRKLVLFKEESAEHAANSMKYINQIEYPVIKKSMISIIDQITLKNTMIEHEINKAILFKKATIFIWWSFVAFLIVFTLSVSLSYVI
jgi:hypothetical protein